MSEEEVRRVVFCRFEAHQISSTERMLAQAERPADIVRRRLEQAGYDITDGLDTLGEGNLSFLLKFVYKSFALGPAVGRLTTVVSIVWVDS